MASAPIAGKAVTGTKEWEPTSFNCVTGCPHNCRYCYARDMAVRRFGRVASVEDWAVPRTRPAQLKAAKRRYAGGVMFPSTHDTVPETMDFNFACLDALLAAGNHVLFVSKPHLECIRALCDRFAEYVRACPDDSPLHLRFTIGADDDELLHFWEPGAPPFSERLECLRLAHERGFSTSVSMEPILDPPRAAALARRLLPYVTDSVWLGLMNRAEERCFFDSPGQERRLSDLLSAYRSEVLDNLYAELRDEPKVKWKFEIRRRLGI